MSRRFRICVAKGGRWCFRPSYGRPKFTLFSEKKEANLRCSKKNVSPKITFNHHLRAIKRTAKERRSDILDNIWFLPDKDDSVVPFYKILNETHQGTALYRRQDNKNFCFLSDYRKRLSRAQNFHKNNIFQKFLRRRGSY